MKSVISMLAAAIALSAAVSASAQAPVPVVVKPVSQSSAQPIALKPLAIPAQATTAASPAPAAQNVKAAEKHVEAPAEMVSPKADKMPAYEKDKHQSDKHGKHHDKKARHEHSKESAAQAPAVPR